MDPANLSLVEFLAGHWDECGRLAEEAHEVALQVGQEPQRLFALGVRALVRASRGDVEGARDDAAGALEPSEERGIMIATILASSALGLLELSLGRPEATHQVLGPLVERLEQGGVREPGSARFIPDEIEALIALGSLEEAETLLVRLERRAGRLDRVSALAAAGRCRGCSMPRAAISRRRSKRSNWPSRSTSVSLCRSSRHERSWHWERREGAPR